MDRDSRSITGTAARRIGADFQASGPFELMDLSQSLSALLAIIVIDLVLAGDNAIVIALAARSLPVQLQKRAIVWGAAGAIVVRSLMTVIVVWLLHIPGLLLAGGLLLVWIAYRLLGPRRRADSRMALRRPPSGVRCEPSSSPTP